jgi:Nif-specific regulatory protein
MQTKLLRTLQEGTITRLGGKQEIHVDVRWVAATNRDLQTDVARGEFRQDLFYRLNVIPIHLPSLAQRSDDVRELALHFISDANQVNQRNVNLSAGALARLQQYSWPGNIRELANLIERMVLLADRPLLDAAQVERFLPQENAAAPVGQAWSSVKAVTAPADASLSEPQHEALSLPMRPYGRFSSHSSELLEQTLRQCGGNKTRAAQMLGMTARQFNYRWSKLGLTDT